MQQGTSSLKNVPVEIYEEKKGDVQAGIEDKRAFLRGCLNSLSLGTESCSLGNAASSVTLPLHTSTRLDLTNLFLLPLYISAGKLKFPIELVGVEGREHLDRILWVQDNPGWYGA